jgi:predicted CopG family antitoxin
MHKKMTITLDEAIYYGLYQIIGKRKISQFIENLVKPYVSDTSLDAGYKAMAADTEREKDAFEWCNTLIGDIDESR